MRHLSSILYSISLVVCLALTACCDDNDVQWQPGKPVAKGTPIVYFSKNNQVMVPYKGEANPTFSVVLERQDTKGSLTVPVKVVKKTGEMQVPKSVTFADGEAQATLEVAYQYSKGLSLGLALPEGYGDPYKVVDGSLNYHCLVARSVKVGDVNFAKDNMFYQTESEVYNYEGFNRFYFTNFLGSGLDVDFRVDTSHNGVTFNPEDLTTLTGDFVPLTNCIEDEYGDGWYVYDSQADEYPTWTIKGLDNPIYYLMCYSYDSDQEASYSYVNFKKNYNSCITMLIYTSEDFQTYIQRSIMFTIK